MSAWVVFAAALVTALATGLGALPLLLGRQIHDRGVGLATAAAAGFMLGASVGLFLEGIRSGPGRTAAGAVAGAVFIVLTRRLLGHRREVEFGVLRGADARGAVMIVGVMTVHSFTEGVGVGVAFGDGQALGVLIATAIAVHNIPEGLAISLVLVPRGIGVGRAAGWSVFSSLPQPLMAVPAFLLVEWFQPFLPVGLGFAGGAMVWMVGVQLLPDARRTASAGAVAGATAVATAVMVALQVLFLS
ncbi:MAG TPA: ZIP family metal transporter [Gaiellaceae bacterium]